MKILMSALFLLPAAAIADGNFDGTWKTRPGSVSVTGKPDVYLLADGAYACSSCDPAVKVKADGAEQAVTGHDYFDSLSVRVTGPNSIERVYTKHGKEMTRVTDTVSADGKMLNSKFTDHTGKDVATGEVNEKRVAGGPAGSHPVSGSWQQTQYSGSDTSTTVQYEMSADAFKMHWNGLSYDAKFDGKQYPVMGDPGGTRVSVKKIDPGTVEETDYRQGKVVDEIRLVAGKDGKTINVTDHAVAYGQTISYTLDKQ